MQSSITKFLQVAAKAAELFTEEVKDTGFKEEANLWRGKTALDKEVMNLVAKRNCNRKRKAEIDEEIIAYEKKK